MPETRIKKLCVTPSTGRHNVEGSTSRTNNNLLLPVQINPIRIQNQNRNRERERPRGQRNTTEYTASQEMKLKAGDMRIARMQVTMSKLRSEMEASRKLLQELCAVAKIDVETYNRDLNG